jgi:plasmid stabilization system protein ParE
MVELAWHVEAASDLAAAAQFITRDSPIAASLFTARIVASTERLAEHPRLGRRVPEISNDSYRELIFQNYRIVYRLLPAGVFIIGVINAAMDMERQVNDREWDIT